MEKITMKLLYWHKNTFKLVIYIKCWLKKESEKTYHTYQYVFLLKDYNANKKSIQKELFVFLQAIEDSSGLKILVQYELEEAQRNQNKKKSTYKETSDIYSEWWQKKVCWAVPTKWLNN